MKLEDLDPSQLDALAAELLSLCRVPGAALAIVDRKGSRLLKAYGVRDQNTQASLTRHTLYPIASTTKAMNATLLGLLVYEGVLEWDAPVQRYLPQFRLQDAFASARVTVRDLVCMRTGLPRHDMLWLENPISYEQVSRAAVSLMPSAEFRHRFQYNNVTTTIAAHVAEAVTGLSWEKLLVERLLSPLEMVRTRLGWSDDEETTNSYHENVDRELIACARLRTSPIGPAGGLVQSTVEDMSNWVALNLNHGRHDGIQVVPEKVLAEVHSPQVVMGSDPVAPSELAAYGLGWELDTFLGFKRVSHGGDLHDVNSCVTLLPEAGIGIVSFVNLAVPKLARALNDAVLMVLSGGNGHQIVRAAMRKYEQQIQSTQAEIAAVRRVSATSPALPLEAYAGRYAHPGYGELVVATREAGLVLGRGVLSLPLQHWHYDTWAIEVSDMEIFRWHFFARNNCLNFELEDGNRVTGFKMRVDPAVDLVRFARVC